MYKNPGQSLFDNLIPKELPATLQVILDMQVRQTLALERLAEGGDGVERVLEHLLLAVQYQAESLSKLVQGVERVTAGLHGLGLYLELHLKNSHPETVDRLPNME